MTTGPVIIVTEKIFWWFPRFFRWLLEARWGLTAFCLIAVSIGISVCVKSEQAFRISGLVLQIFGVFTVVWNIHDTSGNFGQGMLSPVGRWLRRFPNFTVKVSSGVGNASTPHAAVDGRAIGWMGLGTHPSVEERLNAIEYNLTLMKTLHIDFENEVKKLLKQKTDALEEEKRIRAADDKDIQEKLKAAALGGMHIATAGVICLFVGVAMSTASQELANFLRNV